MERSQIRGAILKERDCLSPQQRAEKSQIIVKQIISCPAYQQAEKIFSYMSFRSEVDTQLLHKDIWNSKKKLYLPKTDSIHKIIRFFPISSDSQLESGYQGIKEPVPTVEEYQPKEMDSHLLMLMPCAAFDANGFRMGYGGGYYDRYLAKFSWIPTIALAFDCQQAKDTLPECHDVKPDRICTETRWL